FSPNLDKLALESMWFDNLYATGTRSVRGIEAVISGFLPTPLSSVVKLGKSQNNFFTVANVLKQSDYKTSFIYGGEAHFDNMKRFFSNNGFQTIVEEKDFTNPTYVGSWGVSDEDLFAKADHVFSQHAASGERFFSLVFTSSNHAPFDFPDGRVTVPGDQHNVGTAVRYADYALGQFIAQAKKSNYWDNTVFLIVADHSDRVFGDKLVPINKFHIPALILGKAIQPRRITKLASQIDLLPTLLSLTGVSVAHPAVGIDFTRKDLNTITGKAIMQYGKTLAFMEEVGMEESEQENQKRNRVIIFRSEQAPLQFEYYDKTLIPKTLNATLKQRALAYTLLPIHLYGDRTYRLPNTKTDQIAVMQKPDANTANPYVN
ncbi:MAG: LTA synthase family protein, partial [Gammaproteobacteria bacterium]